MSVRQLANFLTPLRMGLVIDDIVGPELPGTRELFVAARCRDHARATCFRELQSKYRDTTRALNEDGLSRSHRSLDGDGAPCGQTRARHPCPLLPSQVARHPRHAPST